MQKKSTKRRVSLGFRWARRGEKCPKGYTTKYMYRDSDYVTHRSRAFVKKAKTK